MGGYHRSTVLVVGVGLGLLIGLNLQGLWPHIPLHATATHGQDNFAIATGLVTDSVEAIYFLDFLTGDLKAAVLNPQLGKFNAMFRYNIARDFDVSGAENPRYMMVTGQTEIPRGRANYQFARSVVYIAEATSGQLAAYVIPWSQGSIAARKPQAGQFVPLDRLQFRTQFIRD